MDNTKNTINIALAGNANVGKSVIFNQLTGLSQTIGNWPGKTVEKKEGRLNSLGYHFNIVDLPGIYSLSTYSLEEIVSREYIVSDEVDIIINVIDATNFERNLFFTIQLLELKVPLLLAINQMDILRKRGRDLNFKILEEIFKLPVVSVVAIHGTGVDQLIKEAIKLVEKPLQFPDLPSILSYGKEVEIKVKNLIKEIEANWEIFYRYNYPSRFLAIKILESDDEIKKIFKANQNSSVIFKLANEYRKELEEYHGEDINTIISAEIYNNIHKIIERVVIVKSQEKRKRALADKLDHLTTHSFWGYIILVLVLLGTYYSIFLIGDLLGGIMEEIFGIWSESVYKTYGDENALVLILWDGGVGGFFGAVGGVLVYIIPFFLIIEVLQDSGYLPRVAFLMDRFMHSMGVHGKTIIPMILGFGCNVPACAACRIMETEREKKISVALTSLIPCAAVMVVVLGMVGRYLGLGWVVFLYGINFSVIIIVGKILNKVMPGECTELIMEMHEYRVPNYGVIMKQTWVRTKEFIYKSLPIIISLGILLEVLFIFRILDPINIILSPITVFWLGLPLITGIFLIYGILRKELTLVFLVVLASSKGLTLIELLTPIQMIIFCMVTMLYIPCFATIVIIARKTNRKFALQISLIEIGIALLIGGIINWGFILFTGF